MLNIITNFTSINDNNNIIHIFIIQKITRYKNVIAIKSSNLKI